MNREGILSIIFILVLFPIALAMGLIFMSIYIIEKRLNVYGPVRRFMHEHKKVKYYISGRAIYE